MIRIQELGLTFSDGDEWEIFCEKCLKIKFQHANFFPVPADNGGDYGLDGFNKIGDAFQCYCPEKSYTDQELYEHQRDKVTKDIDKLKKYKDKIAKLLNGTKIKTWHFVTPQFKSKELILHCNKKEKLVKSWNLDFIDKDFTVSIKDCGYFLKEIQIITPSITRGIDFKTDTPSLEIMKRFKNQHGNNQFVKNALRKNEKLFPSSSHDQYVQNIVKLTDRNIEAYIRGESLRARLASGYDQQYEHLTRVTESLERQIEDDSLIPVADNREKLTEIRQLVKTRLEKEFPNFLSSPNKDDLARGIVATWIMNCSLDFA